MQKPLQYLVVVRVKVTIFNMLRLMTSSTGQFIKCPVKFTHSQPFHTQPHINMCATSVCSKCCAYAHTFTHTLHTHTPSHTPYTCTHLHTHTLLMHTPSHTHLTHAHTFTHTLHTHTHTYYVNPHTPRAHIPSHLEPTGLCHADGTHSNTHDATESPTREFTAIFHNGFELPVPRNCILLYVYKNGNAWQV